MIKWVHKIREFSWALLFLTLPVTNFPYFPGGVGGETLIRPLVVYPLILLVLLMMIPRLFKRPLPKTVLPLLAFVIVATISSLIALTTGASALRGIPMSDRILRNLITLGIGGSIFFTIVLYPDSWQDMNKTLRWLYAGFAIALFWGTLQAFYVIHFSPTYFDWLNNLQGFISTRRLFETRISGMTYEPKWFAEQLSFLLLPWLLASVIQRRSVFNRRYRWLTIEWLLLIWTVVILFFTFSRTGYGLLVIATFLGILLSRFFRRDQKSGPRKSLLSRKVIVPALVATLAMVAVVLVVGAQNRYFSRIWNYWVTDRPKNRTFLEYIGAGQRLVYLETAFKMYEESPIFGVGLGNYAFYFEEFLPDRPYNRQPEIIRQITPVEGRVRLITSKNLFARLVAETGLVGTIVFSTFMIALSGCILYLLFSKTPESRYWGIAGTLGIVIFTVLVFSFDSFAIPNMWVVFGLTTAAAHLPTGADLA